MRLGRLWTDGREVLVGLVVALLALWGAASTFGVTRWVAGAGVALGLWVVWTGAQRLRFAGSGGGPGIVAVDEGRLVYMGPLTGGAVDLADLRALDLDRTGRPAHWLLEDATGQSLAIPVDAVGADALFDVFAALPGLDVEAMLAARRETARVRAPIWRRPGGAEVHRLGATKHLGRPD